MNFLDEIDFLTLRCFLAAAHRQNFRAAAESMHISPAAFGKRIAALERQIGAKLFERTTRRVSLSARGAQSVPVVQRFVEECTRLVQDLASPSSTGYSLTIASRFELGLSWLTPALDELARIQPQRLIHLSFGDSADMIERVQSGRVDAAITSSRQRPRGTQRMDLHPEDYVFVGADSLLRSQPFRSQRDAATHTLLDIGPRRPLFRYFLSGRKGNVSWSFKQVQHLGTIAAIRQRVLAGRGVAVLPSYFVMSDLQQGKLLRIFPTTKLKSDTFRLVWLASHPKVERLQELGEDLEKIPLR